MKWTRFDADDKQRPLTRIIPNVAVRGIECEADGAEKKAMRDARMALECQINVVNRQLIRRAVKILGLPTRRTTTGRDRLRPIVCPKFIGQ
ncbi:hypothetical protein K32_45110 [Kaistia sp. 32K]|nr:hypothetical protein K32_45110 [Kaistia sp. 32K]